MLDIYGRAPPGNNRRIDLKVHYYEGGFTMLQQWGVLLCATDGSLDLKNYRAGGLSYKITPTIINSDNSVLSVLELPGYQAFSPVVFPEKVSPLEVELLAIKTAMQATRSLPFRFPCLYVTDSVPAKKLIISALQGRYQKRGCNYMHIEREAELTMITTLYKAQSFFPEYYIAIRGHLQTDAWLQAFEAFNRENNFFHPVPYALFEKLRHMNEDVDGLASHARRMAKIA